MSFEFSDLIDILDGEEFEEKPVDLKTFVTDPNFLGLPPLSELQYTLIEKSSQIYKETTLTKLFGEDEGKRVFKQTCTEEPGIKIIRPTNEIRDNVSLRELGNYIAIKYVNKYRNEKIAIRNEKTGSYVSDLKYSKKEIQPLLANVKKCIGKLNRRIPIDTVSNSDFDIDENTNFTFHMILFCVWWKANNDTGIDEYYAGIKEVFDIVNMQFPESPLEFNESNTVKRIKTADPWDNRDNKSFEQLVLDITHTHFTLYTQERANNFCGDYYPDCGETSARNIINILCFDGMRFDTTLLEEKGAVPALIEYYTVFNTFESQSKPDPTDAFGLKLNARDAWSKLVIENSQTNIVFNETCYEEPKNGYNVRGGLSKDGTKSNLLQMLNNLFAGIKTWEDLVNDVTIMSVDTKKTEKDGTGEIIITNADDVDFTVYLQCRHYYVDLPKNNDEINYDHITDEKQIAILDVLLKQHITEKNYIEINFSPELLERTYNDFKNPINHWVFNQFLDNQ